VDQGPDLIRDLLILEGRAATGQLEVASEGVHTLLYFVEGQLVYAEGGTLSDTLGRVLTREGTLTRDQYVEVLKQMTDALVEHEEMRFGEVAIGLGDAGDQFDQLAPQRGVVDLGVERGQQRAVDAAGVRPAQLGGGQQVGAEVVQHAVQFLARQADAPGHAVAVERVEFGRAQVAIGQQRQRDDAAGGTGAVAGVVAHGNGSGGWGSKGGQVRRLCTSGICKKQKIRDASFEKTGTCRRR